MKRVVIIAGPNGAGKTTFARELLPNEVGILTFINADLIAAGLSPFAPEAVAVKAGRLMLEAIDEAAAGGRSFAFETTLSGLSYLRRIRGWQGRGYSVELIFLRLPTADAAMERVDKRVAQGGHDVPDEVVVRRFDRGLRNLPAYCRVVDKWSILDGSGDVPRMIEEGGKRHG